MCSFMKNIRAFACTAVVCAGLLLAVCALIPQSAIRQSCLDAETYFSANESFPLLFERSLGSRMDHYADAALLNVIYNVNEEKPLYSMIAAPYYRIEGHDIRMDYRSAVVDGLAPNSEYSRYWHGSQVLIRPLLLFTSVTGCRIILFALLLALNAVLAVLLMQRKAVRPLLIYLAALLAVQFFMTAFTLEYVMVFLVAAGACIAVAVSFARPHPPEAVRQRMTVICIVSGAVTCFVDFLTAETLAFTIPVLLWMMLDKERRDSSLTLRQMFVLLVRWGVAWLAAYAAMFAVKWVLVFFVLGKEAFWGIFSSAAYRVNRPVAIHDGQVTSTVVSGRLAMMLARNLGCLFPISSQLTVPVILWSAAGVLLVLGAVFYLFRGTKLDGAFIAGQLLLGAVPYLRFLVLSSHAYDHYFFTYRAQMATVMALCGVMVYSLKPSQVLKPQKRRRKSRR